MNLTRRPMPSIDSRMFLEFVSIQFHSAFNDSIYNQRQQSASYNWNHPVLHQPVLQRGPVGPGFEIVEILLRTPDVWGPLIAYPFKHFHGGLLIIRPSGHAAILVELQRVHAELGFQIMKALHDSGPRQSGLEEHSRPVPRTHLGGDQVIND